MKAKLNVEPHRDGRIKFYLNGPCQMYYIDFIWPFRLLISVSFQINIQKYGLYFPPFVFLQQKCDKNIVFVSFS